MNQHRTGVAEPVCAERPWVAAMIQYVTRTGQTHVGEIARLIEELTHRIENAAYAGDRVASRRERAECWDALAAATDQSGPAGQLCALACRCAASLDRDTRE